MLLNSEQTLISGLFLYSKVTLTDGFSDVETRDATLNTQRTVDAIQALIENLENKMIDWAAWDDPYQWMEDQNAKFVESNLGESSVLAMKIDFWAWVNNQREITFGYLYDGQKAHELTPDIVEFIKKTDDIYENGQEGNWKNVNGFVNFERNPMYITAQPIITSEQKGPKHGILITGRWLDQAAIEKLSQVTHLEVSIHRQMNPPYSGEWAPVAASILDSKNDKNLFVQELSETKIAGYSLIKDIRNNPIFFVKMQATRDVKALGQKTISSLLGGIILIGLLIILFVGFLIENMVLKRLSRLSETVNDIHQKNDLSLRIQVSQSADRNDEIGFLTDSMNSLFESQQKSKQSIQRLLDNAGQGFMSFNEHGVISDEFSKAAEIMLSQSPAGKSFWDLFDESQKANIKDVLETVFQELLSFEDLAQMFPKAMVTSQGKYLEFKYRPIRDTNSRLTHVMVIVSDMTEIRNLQVNQEYERRLNGALIKILASPQDFANVLDELYTLKSKIHSKDAFIRSLHTLKGGFALFQCDELAQACHEAESQLKNNSSEDNRQAALERVCDLTDKFLQNHNNILRINKGEEKTVVLPQQSIKTFMQKAIKLGVPREMLHELDYLLEKPATDVFGWLDRVFTTSAEKLGKRVNPIQWKGEPVRLNPLGYEGLIRSLVHVVRNTADHAIESEEERELNGKDPSGNLAVEFQMDGDLYTLTFTDDGRGINIDKLRDKLLKAGKKHNYTDSEVVDSIFESGVTSKDEVSELSGRGVGLDAVRFEARKLGGDVSATTLEGQGTTIKIWFKKLAAAERILLAS